MIRNTVNSVKARRKRRTPRRIKDMRYEEIEIAVEGQVSEIGRAHV